MPIPKPNKGESKDDFISRCMGNSTMNSDYPDNAQRSAICYKAWGGDKLSISTMNKRTVEFYVPFSKTDDEQRMVYGYCSSEAKDSQGEIVRREAIQKAWEAYMEYANVREMHQASAVGVTKEFSHDDNGTWIGVKVVDDRAWKFVKEGVYKGFSIGGRVVKKNKNVIEEIVLAEISLVDRPANPKAKFDAIKVDGELVDRFQLEANNYNSAMHKYVEIDGVKYKEDPENAGQPVKGEDGQPVALTAEEIAANDSAAGGGGGGGAEAEAQAAAEAKAAEDAAAAAAAAEAAAAAAGGGEGGGEGGAKAADAKDLKKFKTPITKDTGGVLMLADLLGYANYISECFKMNGKDASTIDEVVSTLKGMIATEATEPDNAELAARAGDLQKLSKAVTDMVKAELGTIAADVKTALTKVEEVAKDVAQIKGTKTSPRPAGSAAVEKVIASAPAAGSSVAAVEKAKGELEALVKEIDEFSETMKAELAQDPGKRDHFMRKSGELHTKLREKHREILDLQTGGGQQ